MNPADNAPPPPEGYSSWLDYAVETFDTRGPALERMFVDDDFPDRDAMRQAARSELRAVRVAAGRSPPTDDPMAPLSAAEIGQALGLAEQSVRAKASAGQLFSIERLGGHRGQEFPAFQTWPGVAGEPLELTLAALAPQGDKGPASGTAAYGFLTSPTDLLGDLAPIEVLLGRKLGPRQIAAVSRALLASSPKERLNLVLMTARAIAGSEDA